MFWQQHMLYYFLMGVGHAFGYTANIDSFCSVTSKADTFMCTVSLLGRVKVDCVCYLTLYLLFYGYLLLNMTFWKGTEIPQNNLNVVLLF